MKISIVMNPYGEEKPGGLGISIFKLTKTLVEYSVEHFNQNRFVIFLKQKNSTVEGINGNFSVKNLNTKYLYFCNPFKFLLNIEKQDWYIFMMPTIPLLFFPKKSLVIIFDFAYLDIPNKNIIDLIQKRIIFFLHYISLKKATKLMSISYDAALSANKNFGIKLEDISVCYLGFDNLIGEKKEINLPENFFLFAGVIKERKNVKNIILAFHKFKEKEKNSGISDFKLVAIGKHEGSYYDEIKELVNNLNLNNDVFFLGFVSSSEKRYIYSKAESLIFPSIAEGFGMPILEAFSIGLPVVTSNLGAMKELAHDAAILVDPLSIDSISQSFVAFAEGKVDKNILINNGIKRAKDFSWTITAQKILESLN